jgi:hypothetical protein
MDGPHLEQPPDVKPAIWRAAILTLCAITAILAVASIFSITGLGGAAPWSGRWGLNPASAPFGEEITDIDPGGPADRAGLRTGDVIDFRANSLGERFWLNDRAFNGKPITLLVHRSSTTRAIVVVPGPLIDAWFYHGIWSWTKFFTYGLSFYASPCLALWLVFFAALIAWRRSHVPQMRLLALALATNGVSAVTSVWAIPWPWASVLSELRSDVIGPLAVALWIAVASSFARPLSWTRRIAEWLGYAIAAIAAGLFVAQSIGLVTLWYDWNLPWLDATNPYRILNVAAVVCTVLAIASSRGAERQRCAWTLVPLFMLALPNWVLDQFLGLTTYFATSVVFQGVTLVQFVAPVALTYAALSRRLIDMGFAMNRAVVFTFVSTIVIGIFILVEWAAGVWLTNATHTTSAIVGMVVALGLGISLRYIHRYTDRFVDQVFFRKRHEDESALRRFAHEASYISDRTTLLERAVRTVKEHTTADDAAILIRDGASSYAFATDGRREEVTQDDPLIVALRAWHKPVDLHHMKDSQLHGDYAFPMVSRGELVGTLICGPKRDGEAYAPDESDALLELAHGVGTAIHMLDADSENSDGVTAADFAEMRDALQMQFRELPKAIARELRATDVRAMRD